MRDMKSMNYPMIAEVKMAPGKGGKMVVKAFDSVSGEEVKGIVYVTLQGAFKAGVNLFKSSEDASWMRVGKEVTIESLINSVSPANAAVSEANNEVMAFLSTCVQKRPETLYVEDLTWKFICRNVMRGGNMLLTGGTGCGKSQTAIAVAKALGRELFYINLGATQDPRGALIGNTHFSKEAGTYFNESAFVKAIQTPNTVVLLDEVSRAHPEAWNILMTVLDPGQRYLRLDEAVGAPTVHVAEGVSFIGTANIGNEFTATRVMDRALIDRFTIAEIPYLTAAQESKLIMQLHPSIGAKMANNLAEIAGQTRAEINSDSARISTPISTRSIIEMGGLITDGFTLEETAEVSIYPLYSNDGGMQSERTFVKQLVQKYISDGTDEELIQENATADSTSLPF